MLLNITQNGMEFVVERYKRRSEGYLVQVSPLIFFLPFVSSLCSVLDKVLNIA